MKKLRKRACGYDSPLLLFVISTSYLVFLYVPCKHHSPHPHYAINLPTNPTNTTQVMNGRFFSGQTVEAYIADGNEKFKKSSEKKGVMGLEGDENEKEEEGKRLDEFGSWLEGEKVAAAEGKDEGEEV